VSSGLVGKTIPEKRCIGPVILHTNVLTYRLEISRAPPECWVIALAAVGLPDTFADGAQDKLTKQGGVPMRCDTLQTLLVVNSPWRRHRGL
jgi:hypothetical protein